MKLRNLLAVSATAFTLLSCNDSDNHPTPGKGELTPITVNIKGNADTRALTGEETGATNENYENTDEKQHNARYNDTGYSGERKFQEIFHCLIVFWVC